MTSEKMGPMLGGFWFDIASAEEAESFACREGLKLTAEWSPNEQRHILIQVVGL
jgi:hypothetical protein